MTMRRRKLFALAVLALGVILFMMPRTVRAENTYSIQVGAWGDSASVGNMGVRAEIRTSVTPPIGGAYASSFWVGDNLENGGFVQFGYDVKTPRTYCLYGQMVAGQGTCLGSYGNVGSEDARWFWQYWPDAASTSYYYAMGPANSVGPSESWHLYQIQQNAASGWDFVLDGRTVWTFNMYRAAKSVDPAYVVAEQVTGMVSASESLGPVEFRNLSYIDRYMQWRAVTSLSALSACVGNASGCGVAVPYGVTVLGPNEIIVGTGEQLVSEGSLLWPCPQTFSLIISTPPIVQVTIDGSQYAGGLANVSLSQGTHSISVPGVVEIDSTSRLRFANWSDGTKELSRKIELNSDTNLHAIYVQQYKLTIASLYPSSGEGWYDEGKSAHFETDTTPHVTNTLGLSIFGGWHDENGELVAKSGGGSIEMLGPTTLHVYWLPLDYLILIAVASILGFVYLFRVVRNTWRRET